MSYVYVIYLYESQVLFVKTGHFFIFLLKQVKSCIYGVQIQSDPPRHSAPEFHVHIRVICMTRVWYSRIITHIYTYVISCTYLISVIHACDIQVYVTAIYTCHRNIYTYIMSCIYRIYVSYMHISYRCMCMRGWYM